MFDTLKLYVRQDSVRDTDLLAEIPVYLEDITAHEKADQIYFSGTKENLRIYVTDRGVSIQGSLAKYYLSDNMQTLRRKDTEQAIQKLSDDLHLPIDEAQVSRIDFAHNFIMQFEPKVYYPYLGESQYYKRYIQPESLYYKNGNRTKLFYDKPAEAKNKGYEIPEVWTSKHVLRYEIRYKRRLHKQFKEPEVKAYKLYEEQFYIKLIDRYVSDFKSIHKLAEINLDTDNMSTPKDFWDQMALLSIKRIGQHGAVDLVEELRAKDALDRPEYYSRLKKEIRDKSKKFSASDSSPLIEELESKVSALKRYYR
ncbi:phage/plasmid replication domain-containing protein [Gracilimonas mengyeensis]|nr:phage/plasmid replication protein [Gracilimonas mengyeensis]